MRYHPEAIEYKLPTTYMDMRAAIGFEYNKVTASSGNSILGSNVTFSIPQFGDFFHDMYLYVKLKQPVLTITASNVSDQPLMRWCSYPGERLLEQVEFEVNGNPLDSYLDTDVNFHREFSVQPNKLTGWNRCIGQEEAESGFLDQPSWAASGVAPSAIQSRIATCTYSGDQTPTGQKNVSVYKEMLIPMLFWYNRDVRLSIPSVAIPYGQRFIKCQLTTGDKLVNLVPRGAGDWTDANIGGSLNYDNMLVNIELYINNIFVNPEVHNIFIKRIGFSLIRVHRQQNINADQNTATLLMNQLKWPIEHLLVGMKMKDYNSSDTSLRRQHLDKWHTFSQITPTVRTTQGWKAGKTTLKNAAYSVPTSTLVVSGGATTQLRLKPGVVTVVAGQNSYPGLASGDLITLVLTSALTAPATDTTLNLTVGRVINDSDATTRGYIEFKETVGSVTAATGVSDITITGATATVKSVTSADTSFTVAVQSSTVDTVGITAHGIPIYGNYTSKFYNAYTPYHYGGPNISTSKDVGALFIPFNLFPGSYQPSGHINVSRAREFYINYTSSVINTSNVGTFTIGASAINFLLISDGSAVLRYST
jgi:major capsid protein